MERSPVGDTHVLNGRYKLLERVGSGGMAAVYKSEDLVLGRIVAIKLLHLSLTDDAEFLKRFQKEAHAAANLSHPNIVTVHDIGQDGDRYYIVMEFVEGATLKQIIRRQAAEERLLPIDRSLDLMMQMCSGIGYAHRSGLVHCDVKPHNILVSQDDHVKVADFGIARAMTETTLTHQGQVWGTPQYFHRNRRPDDIRHRRRMSIRWASSCLRCSRTSYRLKPRITRQWRCSTYRLCRPQSRYTIPLHQSSWIKSYKSIIQRTGTALSYCRSIRPNSAVVPSQQSPHHDRRRNSRRYRQFGRINCGAATDTRTKHHCRLPAARSSINNDNCKPQPASLPETGASSVDDPDWIAILLGIVAFIALIGLIPLWYAVYLAWQ